MNDSAMLLPAPLLHRISSPTRKHRLNHRTAFIALASLLVFSFYLLFIAYPSLNLSQSLLTQVQDHDRSHLREEPPLPPSARRRPLPQRKPQHLQPVPVQRPPLDLSPSEELAALSAFIAALPHNVLPTAVDPNTPLDPQLVLDFDPRSESARDEVERLVEEVWSRFPVMLYTKMHSSDSREVRYLLSNMNLHPAPFFVEVDQRQDAPVLMPLLARLTDVPVLPLLLIGGRPVGAEAADGKELIAEIRRMHETGELTRRVVEAGATVQPGKVKGKKGRR